MAGRPVRTGRGAGLSVVVDEQRAMAALWREHRAEPSAESRDRLFAAYRPFAVRTATGLHARTGDRALERAEAVQLAMEALLQSIDRFDPLRETSFEGYLRPRIHGNIHDALARASEAGAHYSYRRRIERDRVRSLKGGKDANGQDLAGQLSAITAKLALGFMLELAAEDAIDEVADTAPSPLESLAYRQLVAELDRRLDQLPPREAFVLARHYRDGLQFQQIAALLDLSKGRISQLHAQGLARLRKLMARIG